MSVQEFSALKETLVQKFLVEYEGERIGAESGQADGEVAEV